MRYDDDTSENFRKEELRSLAIRGGQLICQFGGAFHALQDSQEGEMRPHADQQSFSRANRSLFPAQYPAAIGIIDQGVRAFYDRCVGVTPRARGLQYNQTSAPTTGKIAGELRKDIRERRLFV